MSGNYLNSFDPVTIYTACATDPQSTRRIPTMSSTSQVGPRLRASPKNAIIKAKSLWSFGISLSIMKLMIKTQNGNVKKVHLNLQEYTLRLNIPDSLLKHKFRSPQFLIVMVS